MPRTYNFDVDLVTAQLDRILQMELAGVVYYTHYSFMLKLNSFPHCSEA